MNIKRHIFRNYDIRGIYPDDLNEEGAYHIGRAVGSYLIRKGLKSVVVGRDNRDCSPTLAENLNKGLLECGCSVTFIDITVTPAIHFLTVTHDFDAGINVTASHNPKNYNGFRLDFSNAQSLYGAEIEELYNLVVAEDYENGTGNYFEADLSEKYIEYFVKNFKLKNNIRVIINCGGGATSVIAAEIFKRIGADVVPIHCKYDPTFAHNVPDPENAEFMKEVAALVLEHGARVGFGFDADGDRFGVSDEKGTFYAADRTLLLFAEHILKKNPGKTIICDVKSSGLVKEVVNKNGGIFRMIKTGHPYFTQALAEDAVILGAELSGHVYFGDKYYGFDDGIYAACRVLEILDEEKVSLSALMAKFPSRVSTPEIKVACSEEKKFSAIEKIKKDVKAMYKPEDLLEIDGIRVKASPTGWFLIRASNTSPYLSVRVEGKNEKEVSELMEKIIKLLSKFEFLDFQNIYDATFVV